MVMEKFSEIENKNVEIPKWPRQPYDDEQYGTKVMVVPVKDLRSLTISFTTDDLSQFYKSAVSIFSEWVASVDVKKKMFLFLAR